MDAGGRNDSILTLQESFFEESEKEYFESYVKDNKLEEYVTYHGIVGGDEKEKAAEGMLYFALPTRYRMKVSLLVFWKQWAMECLSLPQITLVFRIL